MDTKFEFEKETKNKIRFKEIGVSQIIGTLYIEKRVLKELDYKQGQIISVNISKEE